MHALISSGMRRNAQLDIPFEDFLSSGRMHSHARAAMCSPEELIVDYLPPFDAGDPAEVREAFGEACYQAADGDVDKIEFDADDLRFIQDHFVRARQFRLVPSYLPDAA